MVHLTLSPSDGRPLCNCHFASHQAIGDSFLAIEYASHRLLSSDELCLACKLRLDSPPTSAVFVELQRSAA